MKLSEVKAVLESQEAIAFQLPDGKLVPQHFHVTEVGKVTKHFIDCGGTKRLEEVASLQLWEANDYDHRLHPEKLLHILNLSQEQLQMEDLPVEVEYQGETIGKYDLGFNNGLFLLMPKQTDCLAKSACGVPDKQANKVQFDLSSMTSQPCTPGGGCC